MPVELENILGELGQRFKRVRSAVAVGFGSEEFRALSAFRGGLWMEAKTGEEIPFDDSQFEVAVIASGAVSREMVREANRVLISDGCLFFAVNAKRRSQEGYTPPEIYKLVREGFDILSVRSPKWWQFGFKGHMLSVCARKKAWRELRGFQKDRAYIFAPFGGTKR